MIVGVTPEDFDLRPGQGLALANPVTIALERATGVPCWLGSGWAVFRNDVGPDHIGVLSTAAIALLDQWQRGERLAATVSIEALA